MSDTAVRLDEVINPEAVILDTALQEIRRGNIEPAMNRLNADLDDLRARLSRGRWKRFTLQVCRQHPVLRVLHQCPITRRAYGKPRGYPGDAELVDLIYSPIDAYPHRANGISREAREIHRVIHSSPTCESVRARREHLVRLIDSTADRVDKPRILSLACGHLREAQDSASVKGGRIGEFIALDHDPQCLAVVEREQSVQGIVPVCDTVVSLVEGNRSFHGFDLAYAAGLFDYLPSAVAARLTSVMFDSLRAGGRLCIANFASKSHGLAYLEAFMDWWLIARTESDMDQLAEAIPPDAVARRQIVEDSKRNVLYLEITKK